MSTNTYIAKTKAAEAAFSAGAFEHEFTPDEESDWLASGALELVPRSYRALTDKSVQGVEADGIFEAAYPAGVEAALIQGGHIARVAPKPPAEKKQKEAKG